MRRLESRNHEDMDDGDRMAFALSGVTSVASQALKECLAPGSRGWVDTYPGTILELLEFHIREIRALDTLSESAETDSIKKRNAETADKLFENEIRIGQTIWLAGSGQGFADHESFENVIMDACDGEPYMHESMKVFRDLPDWARDEEGFLSWTMENGINGFIVEIQTPKPVKFHAHGHTSYGFGLSASTWLYIEDLADVPEMAIRWRNRKMLDWRQEDAKKGGSGAE